VGGSILSAKLALERGWAVNVGGGFHHCSAEEGGGFCAYADITLCIQFAFVWNYLCDLYQVIACPAVNILCKLSVLILILCHVNLV
jgi:hypothetical protein